ncbi:MAG: hypothetical protein RL387_580 [Bacteroidota bacterium]
MRWLPVYFLFLTLSNASPTASQSADLSKGKWVKMTTTKQAIYQVTGTQLKQMGIAFPISSSKIQLFGYDLTQLKEKVTSDFMTGSQEISIMVKDGGDGSFDEKDHFLFYASGNLRWEKESTTGHWKFQKLHHSDTAYYFFTIGENGKRIANSNYSNPNTQKINTYQAHQIWEQDSVNILNSGKLWLSAPMGQGLGKTSTISYSLNTKKIVSNAPVLFDVQFVSTNYNQSAQFDIKWNDIKIKSANISPVSGLVYDAAAKSILDSFSYWPILNNTSNSAISVQYNAPQGSTGYVDFISMHIPMQLGFGDNNYFVFDGQNEAQDVQYQISDADASGFVWDISNPLQPFNLNTNYLNNTMEFAGKGSSQQKFIALKQNAFETIAQLDTLTNQNIFNNTAIDYIILAPAAFQEPAIKLKNFHEKYNGFKVTIVDPVKIYNEFSGGLMNPIAIRNYLKKMQMNAKALGHSFAQYLCIIGGSDFNLKKLNKFNQVPVFESANSLDILNTYASDDFYAVLKDGADMNIPSTVDSLEIAIGRIPAKTLAEADTLINKIIQYRLSSKKGVWQNQITWIADDGDYNLHLQDAESIINGLQLANTLWNHKKIYLDLFTANNNAGGISYPLVENEIQQTLNNGSLVVNYTGHGNYLRLTEEAVINDQSMQSWNNEGRLPLLITASCDFAPYDQPQFNPIGFSSLMKNGKGIIGLVAANRLVFAYSNKQINEQFIQALLVSDKNGTYNSIGKALQIAKKNNWALQGDKLNAFKFNLLGDPALLLASVKNKIQLNVKDSLTAGTLTTIDGTILKNQAKHSSFNGLVDCIVFDVVKDKITLANQSTSIKTIVPTREAIIYRGKATVTNGQFTLNFVLPKETSSSGGNLKIQAFAYNNMEDALGVSDSVFVKASNLNGISDLNGPQIRAYINDTNFTNNSWVTNNATLIVYLKDSAGIQSSGNALGHDLQFILDNDVQYPYLLNNYYTADIDTYQSGTILFGLPNLTIGKHQLIIKAWDLLGNLSKDTLWLIVPEKNGLKAKDLLNKPNPMNQFTQFSFDLNVQDISIETEFSLRNLNGQQLVNKILPHKNLSNKWVMDWDGRDQSGAMIPPGFYIYTITIRSSSQVFVLSNKLIKL